MSSVKALYDAAIAVIRTHNEALDSADAPGFVDEDKFLKCLKASGGTTEEILRGLSHENVLACLPEYDGVKPWPLAKAIAKVFRSSSNAKDDVDHTPKNVSAKRAEKMSLRELIEAFDPENPNNPVGQRLQRECRNEQFIVYQMNRTVDVDSTLELLKEVKQGFEGRSTYKGKKVWAIGDLPDNYADENPLYPGRPLRPDGSCDQLNRSWEGAPHEVRQFVKFGLDYEDGTDPEGDRDKAHRILDMAISPNAMEKFAQRYPEIYVEFEETRKNTPNQLPDLRIPLGKSKEVAATANPFDGGRRVVWDVPTPNQNVNWAPPANYYTATFGTDGVNDVWHHKVVVKKKKPHSK